jgi:penicillin-binding protein 2
MQHHAADRTKSFTRRALFVGATQTAMFGLLAGRLWQLQVDQATRYSLLAEENRVSQRLTVPPRGRILDRNGTILARNVPSYRVRIIRENTRDLAGTLRALARLIPLDERQQAAIIETARTQRAFVPVLVREGLSWDEVTAVAVHSPHLPGVMLDSTLLRDYPHGELLAHVLGYVGPVNKDEQAEDDDPLMRLPEFRIGKNGIEASYDRRLRGRAGLRRLEVNAIGREIRELDRDNGEAGEDVRLSLDMELQQFTYERLSAELSASAVVVDVATGAVLALASVPSFDPTAFLGRLSHQQWKEWRDSPRTPLVNKCIRGQYPPGSTFKMIVGLAALEAGLVTPSYDVFCGGYTSLGNARFHCWKSHGRVALHEAISQSCDVYFYDLARRVGVDGIAAMARRFGLGEPLGLDLPGEQPGLVPTSQWKREALGEPWQRGETLVVGIGQGFMLATPLQLAIMTARMCNGGRAVSPWFVRDPAEPPPEVGSIGVSQVNLDDVLKGMHMVVNAQRGTAHRHRLTLPDVQMAGKTGTSQVRRITRAERAAGLHKRKDRPWEHRHHALFVCFAPTSEPRYALSVIVEHGQSGSAAAAPIARDIMTKVLELDPARRTLSVSL